MTFTPVADTGPVCRLLNLQLRKHFSSAPSLEICNLDPQSPVFTRFGGQVEESHLKMPCNSGASGTPESTPMPQSNMAGSICEVVQDTFRTRVS